MGPTADHQMNAETILGAMFSRPQLQLEGLPTRSHFSVKLFTVPNKCNNKTSVAHLPVQGSLAGFEV